jgi:hypothetical protein
VKVTTLLVERVAALCHRCGVPFSLVVLQVQSVWPRGTCRLRSVIDCNHPG